MGLFKTEKVILKDTRLLKGIKAGARSIKRGTMRAGRAILNSRKKTTGQKVAKFVKDNKAPITASAAAIAGTGAGVAGYYKYRKSSKK